LDNPIETRIAEFRHFVVAELPRLKYLDWLPITKEEKSKAAKLESDGLWAGKTQPIKETGSPRSREAAAAANNAITRHSVSYAVDFTKQLKSAPSTPTIPTATVPVPAVSAGSPLVTNNSGTDSVRGQQQPVFPTPVTPPLSRRAPPLSRESSQFNGDFSALGTKYSSDIYYYSRFYLVSFYCLLLFTFIIPRCYDRRV
jgi:hypothetical protein